MKKVYILIRRWDYDSDDILGVFTSEDVAQWYYDNSTHPKHSLRIELWDVTKN